MWVSRKVPTPPSEKELKDAVDGTVTAETFASLALSSSGSEAESVEKKLFIALVAASVALVLTAGAFASALIWPPEEASTGVLTLTTEAAAAVDTICPGVKTSAQLVGGDRGSNPRRRFRHCSRGVGMSLCEGRPGAAREGRHSQLH
jgi:hypothetical protein